MKRSISIGVLALAALALAGTASATVSFEIADTPDLPREVSPEVFMHEWLFLGPFPFPESARTENPSAAWAVDPVDIGRVRTLDGAVKVGDETMAWEPLKDGGDRPVIDLLAHVGPTEFAAAYLGTYVIAEESCDRDLLVGSDDGIVIWLNGEKVHQNITRRGCNPDDDRVPVHLAKGRNLLVAKVIQGIGGWAFAARFADNRGLACAMKDDMAAARPLPVAGEILPGRQPVFLVRPYLQNTTTDGVTLMWWTDIPTTAEVTLHNHHESWSASCGEGRLLHEVRVEGLQPDTPYTYAVSIRNAEDSDAAEVAEGGIFRTFPDSDRQVRFLVYGDTRTHPDRHAWVISRMRAEPNTEAVIHSGDLVSNGRNLDEWVPQFLEPANSLFARVPLFACLGNHEGNSPFYFQLLAMPENGGAERWYSFDLGPVHFIALDSCWDYSEGSEQYEWFRSDLEANREKPWKIVFSHHPTYTSGPHGRVDDEGNPRETPIRIAQALFPKLAEEFGIDIFIAGHDHIYERSVSESVQYIIAGGGGAPTYAKVNDAEKQNPHSLVFTSDLNYAVVTADNRRLEFVAKTPSGQIVDTFVLTADGR